METPASTAPQIWAGSYTSIAAIVALLALSLLIFGVGYYLRKQGKLVGGGPTMIWTLAAILPLLIAVYWGYV